MVHARYYGELAHIFCAAGHTMTRVTLMTVHRMCAKLILDLTISTVLWNAGASRISSCCSDFQARSTHMRGAKILAPGECKDSQSAGLACD